MFYGALVFLVIALVAAVLGFGGSVGTAAGIAQVCFVLSLVFSLITLTRGLMDYRRSPPGRGACDFGFWKSVEMKDR